MDSRGGMGTPQGLFLSLDFASSFVASFSVAFSKSRDLEEIRLPRSQHLSVHVPKKYILITRYIESEAEGMDQRAL